MVHLVCFSDNHGEMPPPSDESSADAWIFAGDFYNGPEINGENHTDADADGMSACDN